MPRRGGYGYPAQTSRTCSRCARSPTQSAIDSERIRGASSRAERAVVVGGGFIGMEVAASLRQLGLDVTLIHMGPGLFDLLGSPELSEQLLGLYRKDGVEVLLEEEVAGFGGAERLEYVEAKSGFCVAASIAVVCVGVIPNIAFLDESGLALDNGVVVNQRFETSAPPSTQPATSPTSSTRSSDAGGG